MRKYDVAIIGGGASGMACAVSLKNKKVVIVEALPRVGKKLLTTGNGKCNLLNLNVEYDFYNDKAFVKQVFDKFDSAYAADFFAGLGLLIKYDEAGRAYPASECAASVSDVLRNKIDDMNIDVLCNATVLNIRKDGCFKLTLNDGEIAADNVVFAAGSSAGGGKDSLNLVKPFVKTRPFAPSLLPLLTEQKRIKGLRGVRVKCSAGIIVDGAEKAREYGEILFKDCGLSGIAAFNLSAVLARNANYKNAEISIDFLPFVKNVPEMLKARLSVAGKVTAERFLVGILHKMLIKNVLDYAEISPDKTVSADDLKAFFKVLCNFTIPVRGVGDMSQAQTACGGVLASELNVTTLESKREKGLYFTGEAVDVDGLSGGYNLLWAWCSAFVVAAAINDGK